MNKLVSVRLPIKIINKLKANAKNNLSTLSEEIRKILVKSLWHNKGGNYEN